MTLISQVQIAVMTTELKVMLLNTIDYYITIRLDMQIWTCKFQKIDNKKLTFKFDVSKKKIAQKNSFHYVTM